jgi:hypothetical protein
MSRRRERYSCYNDPSSGASSNSSKPSQGVLLWSVQWRKPNRFKGSLFVVVDHLDNARMQDTGYGSRSFRLLCRAKVVQGGRQWTLKG